MSAIHPSPSPRDRVRRLVDTVRWAPAPVWGESAGEHTRFSVYLAGSMLAWAVAGLVMAALIGTALGLVV
ncbi:chemotaxis protein CheW [Cellulomonas sp. P5_C5]